MIGRLNPARLAWALATAAACLFAVLLAVDTLRAVVPLWSPLPWFDEWATVSLLQSWRGGDMTAAQLLFSQHNEHRILVPRLVFFADDMLFHGGGLLSLGCIFVVQALHAGVFAAVLGRAKPPRAGRWAVAAVVLAMMFSLRQAENFSSGFQLQFVAVFAGATVSFVLFGCAVARSRDGRPVAGPLVASLAATLATTFTMANGLVAGYVLVAMALAARMRMRVVLACAAWAVLLTIVYLNGYEPVAHHSRPSDSLHHPLRLLLYVASYLGSVFSVDGITAASFGLVGMGAGAWAASRVLRHGNARPGPLAMAAVMLFVGATAVITGAGRLDFGIGQALSSRYVSGSVAFWAAQLAYWWMDPPGRPFRAAGVPVPAGWLGSAWVAVIGTALCAALAKEQPEGKPQLAVQSFAQSESADLLMLGLDDPAVVTRAAWSDEYVRRLLPTLKREGLSIFGTADYAGLGGPVTARGALGPPCAGEIASAVADPRLGEDGARVSGQAADGRRLVRHVLLADARGRVAGFASGAIPGATRDAWRGFAVAPAGATLTAYGLLDGSRLCRIGAETVAPAEAGAPPAGDQASQPVAAP